MLSSFVLAFVWFNVSGTTKRRTKLTLLHIKLVTVQLANHVDWSTKFSDSPKNWWTWRSCETMKLRYFYGYVLCFRPPVPTPIRVSYLSLTINDHENKVIWLYKSVLCWQTLSTEFPEAAPIEGVRQCHGCIGWRIGVSCFPCIWSLNFPNIDQGFEVPLNLTSVSLFTQSPSADLKSNRLHI